MNSTRKTSPSSGGAVIRFACSSCQAELVLPREQGGVSGPCPKCANWIDSSAMLEPAPSAPTRESKFPVRSEERKRRTQSVTSGKGRVRADGFLDHEYNEKREMVKTLKLVSICLAVAAIIFFVTQYMKHWLGE